MRRLVVPRLVALLVFAACQDSTAPVDYSKVTVVAVTELRTMPLASFHIARAVNDAGTIVGSYTEPTGSRAVNRPARWDQAGIIDISGLPPSSSIPNAPAGVGDAAALNASGVAAGDLPGIPGQSPVPLSRAVVFRGAKTEDLLVPRPGRGDPSSARGINDAGDIVGFALFRAPPASTQAALWRPDAVPMNLGALTSTAGSIANDINNAGQIVGSSFTASGALRAVRFESGVSVVDLGTLPGHTDAFADAINDAGVIVGYSTGGSTSAERTANRRAVRWKSTNQIEALAMLPGHTASVANAINEAGDVVGMSVAADGSTKAVMWRDDIVIELGQLPGESSSVAYGINDKGDIVGRSGTKAVHWRISPVLPPNAKKP